MYVDLLSNTRTRSIEPILVLFRILVLYNVFVVVVVVIQQNLVLIVKQQQLIFFVQSSQERAILILSKQNVKFVRDSICNGLRDQ